MRMKEKIFSLLLLTVPVSSTYNAVNATENNSRVVSFSEYSQTLYSQINEPDLTIDSFQAALRGYNSLLKQGKLEKTHLLTVIDFSRPSSKKRLFIINLKNKKVVYKSLVAHGRNSGDDFARSFSNELNSFKSSLGFYVTGELYTGKHGLSMRLDGVDKDSNCKARERNIVMHGADYVSDSFVKQHARLGRSQGCPALPQEITKEVVNLIKDKSCLFIYYPDKNYIIKSTYLQSNPSDVFMML